MTGVVGNRRVEITSLARARMTSAEKAEVHETCHARGLRVNIMFSTRDRAYSALLTAGSRSYHALDKEPMGAWHKVLAQRDTPILSMFDGPAA